ncbi:MAG: FAD-dependent oxidoreductase, partial [Saprospiraceae bacterium]
GIFDLETLPKRLLVVGGGPIGLELGQAFSRLGSEVTIVEAGPQILSHEIPEMAGVLQGLLEAEGVKFLLNTKISAFSGAHTAHIQEKGQAERSIHFDVALVSIGRQVHTQGLDLEKAGIQLEKGKFKINEQLQTTNPDVYVCGDATGDHQFSHAAELQASVLVNNLISPFKKKLSYQYFSWVTFTDPELATFGQSTGEMKKQGLKFQTLELDFTEDDRANIGDYRYGKLVMYTTPPGLLPGREKILGGTMLAPRAGELIQELLLAMQQKLPVQALFQKTYPYPVASRVNKAIVLTQLRKALPDWVKKGLVGFFRI